MICNLLIRLCVHDHEHTDSPAVRLEYGILSGYAGLAVNVLLAAIKFAVGLISGSVAIAAALNDHFLARGMSSINVNRDLDQ